MIEIHLNHAAGVAKLLSRYGVTIMQARANESGAQLLIQESIPERLIEHIEETSEQGLFIFGVWVKQYENKSGAQ